MRKVLIVVLSLAMFCTACSTAWVLTLDSILAAAAPALINILQIVAVANGQPVNANLAAKIKWAIPTRRRKLLSLLTWWRAP